VEDEGEEGGGEEGVGMLVDEGGGDGAKEAYGDPDDGEGLGRWPVKGKGEMGKSSVNWNVAGSFMREGFSIKQYDTYIQEGRFLSLRFRSSVATLGRELFKMEKTRDLKLMKAKNARTTHKLTCFGAFSLINAVSIPYMNATMVANCSHVAITQVPNAPHCIGGPFLKVREGRLSRYSARRGATAAPVGMVDTERVLGWVRGRREMMEECNGIRKPCTAATKRATSTRQRRWGEDVAIVVVVLCVYVGGEVRIVAVNARYDLGCFCFAASLPPWKKEGPRHSGNVVNTIYPLPHPPPPRHT